MTHFALGIIVGSLLTASLGLAAGTLYNPSGQPSAPAGSVQQFDYFRQRQLFLDAGAMRRMQEDDHRRAERERLSKPCAK